MSGFDRMKERMGTDYAERLRLDTLRLQEQALKAVRKEKD